MAALLVPARITGAVAVCAATLIALAGCSRGQHEESNWARAALERNGTLEVVATDPSSGVITVRVKSTGELHTVRPQDLIAALPPGTQGGESAGSPAASPERPLAPPAQVAASTPPPAPPPPQAAAPSAQTAQSAEITRQSGPAAPSAESTQTQAAPSESEQAPPSTAPVAPARPSPTVHAAAGSGKRVIAAGPGYSISASYAPASGSQSQLIENQETQSQDTRGQTLALEQRHEPIVCQGARQYQIDSRNLAFDGDALAAMDGCELLITNSHIAAKGVGVLARSASVHIRNSSIEGGSASVDASDGAQVYAQSSTFAGTIRRGDTAAFHDLGGNVGD